MYKSEQTNWVRLHTSTWAQYVHNTSTHVHELTWVNTGGLVPSEVCSNMVTEGGTPWSDDGTCTLLWMCGTISCKCDKCLSESINKSAKSWSKYS